MTHHKTLLIKTTWSDNKDRSLMDETLTVVTHYAFQVFFFNELLVLINLQLFSTSFLAEKGQHKSTNSLESKSTNQQRIAELIKESFSIPQTWH